MAGWLLHTRVRLALFDAYRLGVVDDIPTLLAYASSVMTLEPDDVLATGTPAGVGPVNGGDTLAIEIERIGRLEVSIQAADANAPIAEPRRLQVAS